MKLLVGMVMILASLMISVDLHLSQGVSSPIVFWLIGGITGVLSTSFILAFFLGK